ncbi:TPM domain-containing protein [Fructobacillus sp. M2-14]|uniref:TPM domain-containing protein n=1 Tax=Fructobacillus broussonetiae TaxID=2713173 RepID=A0ABS5R202_9LACO|nr:TPM domain-containing protein [Fructobacillus broussonetiae]MBS9338579.1 TPM domain-containing protein [Fructobacillus broussonetiae]
MTVKNSGWKKTLLGMVLSLFVLLAFGPFASADDPSQIKPDGENPFITDRAKVLTADTSQLINQQNQRAESDEKQPQIAILTVDSTDGMSIADFTNELTLGKNWKVGSKKENNGILIVFAKNGGQNKIRVATGTGAEAYLPDGKIHQLFVKNQDNLKSQDMAKVDQGIRQLIQDIEASYNQALGGETEKKNPFQSAPSGLIAFILVILAILLVIVIVLVLKSLGRYQGQSQRPGSARHSSGASGFFWGWLIGDLLSSGSRHSYYDDDDDHFGGGGGFGGGGDFGGGGSDF